MDFDIELTGTEANDPTVLSLQDWLKNERVTGMQVERKFNSPQTAEMGADPLTILSVVLAAPAVVELAKSVHTWIKARKPKVKVKFKCKGNEIDVDAENVPEINEWLPGFLAKMGPCEEE